MDYNMELVDNLRSLSPSEYRDLEDSCREHGVLDKIKVWKGYLIDGRHRVKIANKHKLTVFEQEMEFADIDEAKEWILRNQLGQRNLTEIEVQRVRASLAKMTSVEEAANEFGVSERTIQRDVATLDSMDMIDPQLKEKCLSGEIINSREDWKRFGKLEPHEKALTENKLKANPNLSLREALPAKKAGPNQADLDAINSLNHLDFGVKRSIAAGTIAIDHASVKKTVALTPDKQELLSVMLEDPQVSSLKQALQILEGAVKPRTQAESIRIAMMSIHQLSERIEERLNDLDAVGVDTTECRLHFTAFIASSDAIRSRE